MTGTEDICLYTDFFILFVGLLGKKWYYLESIANIVQERFSAAEGHEATDDAADEIEP
jgi:hypothetical protein